MEIDNVIYRKMSEKERVTIEKIIKKATDRPHVAIYDHKYIVNHLLESFKDFSYEEREDCDDMLNIIYDIAKEFKVMDSKEIEQSKKDMINEYVDEIFEVKEKDKSGFDV